MGKNLCIITGGSKGLGRALVKTYLDHRFDVLSIARSSSNIPHPRLTEVAFDLSSISDSVDEIKSKLDSFLNKPYDKITLINNAATLGEIKPIKDYLEEAIGKTITLNLTAPFILCSLFLAGTKTSNPIRTIFNVSSGAAKHAIPGWGLYCSTKAAMDILSAVLAAENPSIKVASVNPGIMDTPMQAEIRASDEQDFPLVDNFRQYKENKLLVSAETIAHLLLEADLSADFNSGEVLNLEERFDAPRKRQ